MAPHEGDTIGVLAERLEGVRQDVSEIRDRQRDGERRIRMVEDAVKTIVDTTAAARTAEQRQYQRVANAIQFGALVMAAAMVALTVITIHYHG